MSDFTLHSKRVKPLLEIKRINMPGKCTCVREKRELKDTIYLYIVNNADIL